MSSVINERSDAPLPRFFVDLNPEKFVARFNRNLRAERRFAAPVRRSELREWENQQAEVRAILHRWDAPAGSIDRGDLEKRLNEGLTKYVTLRVSPSLKTLAPFAKVPPTDSRAMLGIVWIHMARLVTGEIAESRCDQCGAPFKPSRSDARFCRPYCRLKHHRHQTRGSTPGSTLPRSRPE